MLIAHRHRCALSTTIGVADDVAPVDELAMSIDLDVRMQSGHNSNSSSNEDDGHNGNSSEMAHGALPSMVSTLAWHASNSGVMVNDVAASLISRRAFHASNSREVLNMVSAVESWLAFDASILILFLLVLLCFIVFVFVCVYVCVCVCVCAYGPPWPSTLRSGARIDDVHAAMTIKQGVWRYKRPATVVPVPWWSPVGVIHIL